MDKDNRIAELEARLEQALKARDELRAERQEHELEVERLKKIVGNRADYSDEEFEVAWKHFLTLRWRIRESDSESEKGPLMNEAIEHAKKYGIDVRGDNVALREEIERLRETIETLQHTCNKYEIRLGRDAETYIQVDEPEVPNLSKRVQELEELVQELFDEDSCHYDHHGYCQAHSLHPRPCPHERAKVYFRALLDSDSDEIGSLGCIAGMSDVVCQCRRCRRAILDGGKGKAAEKEGVCSECQGEGRVDFYPPPDADIITRKKCPTCKGTGKQPPTLDDGEEELK